MNPDFSDFMEKKQQVVQMYLQLPVHEIPDRIIFNYFGFSVDITDEIFQNI